MLERCNDGGLRRELEVLFNHRHERFVVNANSNNNHIIRTEVLLPESMQNIVRANHERPNSSYATNF